ncbi:2OG-Fe(II) oxygenase [Xenorhabdus littoralis]|uniref:2OG-Fe(II) oxygenase n=1 Tax=Xenorhabdus littoralis TaxID=2582835 RepID=UPI0029E7E489|nr:2OG-Fe(II) oxygenase [Xenorhabdus sp. psl]MDX7992364.1 2OG-Fe(II) oxygenase [Xenorhabdus sp. psl]
MNNIIEVDRLDVTCIQKLAGQEILAIRVKNFVPNILAVQLGEKILGSGFDKYLNAPSIGRIGMAFYEAENEPSRVANYFESVFKNIDELRQRCSPYFSPIDQLRCILDEVWPSGALLETLYGKKMYVGLSRVVTPGITFLAHHDIFAKDAPDSFRAKSIQAQFAANVYLSMPSKGGALQVWKNKLSPEEFDSMRGDNYGIEPSLLGEPTIEIQPNVGDLLIFNSQCMHAVTAGTDDLRLSLSCFIGYRGLAEPLSFWS